MKVTALSCLVNILLATSATASSVWSRSPQNIAKLMQETREKRMTEMHESGLFSRDQITPRSKTQSKLKYYNEKTKHFFVNGTKGNIPDVNFDLSESYSGLLPISKRSTESRKLFFWFWPTTGDKRAEDDITIWLNGGPGCSSLEGFLQENGPFTWKYGTYLPVQNKYTWVNLTNMIWVEQPVGTGFSEGEPNINSEEELAQQFLGFMQNVVDTFGLHGKRIWITGESYAGRYVPYIADAMFARKDKKNFNIKGTMMYDPSIDSDFILGEIPAYAFVEKNSAIFNLPAAKMAQLKSKADKCKFTDYYRQGLTFPPKGAVNYTALEEQSTCKSIWEDVMDAASKINPCFNIYHIMTTCPDLWDVLGFPGSYGYLPEGAKIYFARPEVAKALNVKPKRTWKECSSIEVFPKGDKSDHPTKAVLPRVIEKSERTVIAHGLLDFILMADGTLMALNNMVWGGKRGFSVKPHKKFNVPYEKQGEMGVWHEERGLTYIDIKLAGHMVPQYQPGAGYRHMEYLLGRVKDLSK